MRALSVVIAFTMAVPLIQLSVSAFSRGPERVFALVFRERTADLLLTTAGLVAVVCLGTLVLGTATAIALYRAQFRLPQVWVVLACLPLAVPSYVGTFALLAVFPSATGFFPLAIVLTLTLTPYVTLPTLASLRLSDPNLADVSKTLGRNRIRTFVSATMPQLTTGALSGCLIVALYVLSDFGAPAFMRVETLTTGVYALFSGSIDRAGPAAVSIVLVVVAMVVVAGESVWRRRHPLPQRVPAELGRRDVRTSPLRLLTATALAIVFSLSVVAPLTALLYRGITASSISVDLTALVATGMSTLGIGALAGLITTVIALPIAVLAARRTGAVVRLVEQLTFVGAAVPGVVVGLALVALGVGLLPAIYQTLFMLIIAYVILFLPRAIASIRSGIARVPQDAIEVSRTLGVGSVGTFLRVTLRIVTPSMFVGWLLVTTAVMKELPATLMLRPIGLETLATTMWQSTSLGAYGSSAPAAIALVAVGAIPAILLARSVNKS